MFWLLLAPFYGFFTYRSAPKSPPGAVVPRLIPGKIHVKEAEALDSPGPATLDIKVEDPPSADLFMYHLKTFTCVMACLAPVLSLSFGLITVLATGLHKRTRKSHQGPDYPKSPELESPVPGGCPIPGTTATEAWE
jgi:hypothetical protein